MACELGHSWEVFSGDQVVCIECDATGEVELTWDPDDGDGE